MLKLSGIILGCTGCLAAFMLLHALGRVTTETVLALGIGTILLAAVLVDMVSVNCDGLDLGISNLPGLYGFFYALYYLGALVSFAARDDVRRNNIVEIAALMLLGYIGWRSGLALSGRRKVAMQPPMFDERQAMSLLVVCWIGFAAVLLGFAYLASVGAFFSHGTSFSQAPTLAASFLLNLTLPFEGPVLMVAALLSSTGGRWTAAKVSLWTFLAVFCALHLMANQFRWILTDMVLVASVLQLDSGFRLTWRRVVIGSAFCFACLLLIQAARTLAAQEGGGSLDPKESISLLSDTVEDLAAGSVQSASTATKIRASNSLLFLSDLIDCVRGGAPYIYGKAILYELSALVPRVLWPDKPVYKSAQIVIREDFWLPEHDDSPGPLISYYAAGGPVGVICGLFFFGLTIGFLHRWAAQSPRPLPWMLLIWVLSANVSIETDQTMDFFAAIRHCIVVYVAFRLILLFAPDVLFTPRLRGFTGRTNSLKTTS